MYTRTLYMYFMSWNYFQNQILIKSNVGELSLTHLESESKRALSKVRTLSEWFPWAHIYSPIPLTYSLLYFSFNSCLLRSHCYLILYDHKTIADFKPHNAYKKISFIQIHKHIVRNMIPLYIFRFSPGLNSVVRNYLKCVQLLHQATIQFYQGSFLINFIVDHVK